MRLRMAAVALLMLWAAPTQAVAENAFSFTFSGLDGKPLALETWRGKALLVVNTASRCGYTYQYQGLEQLWQSYREKGLVVIGVPSNDFGAQEPLKGEGIENFCRLNYGVTFPLADRTPVTGAAIHPFYRWAVETGGPGARPAWNFHKLLISPDGRLVAAFTSAIEPLDQRVREAVEKLLPDR